MLNEKQLRALKPREREYTISDDGQRGTGRLFIRVRPTGAKDWVYVYYLNKRRRKIGLGAYPEVALKDARQRAADLAAKLTDGVDPGKAMREQRAAAKQEEIHGSLGELIISYTNSMREQGRRTADEVLERCERYVKKPFPKLWNKPAREVTSADIRDLLSFHMRKGITTTTNRIRSWLHAAYQHGLSVEHDPRQASNQTWALETNPVSVIPRQADWERQGERVITAEELAHAWHNLPSYDLTSMAIRLVIATGGQRPLSLLRLAPANIDFDADVIDIPASSMKSSLAHVVPMASQSRDLLRYLVDQAERNEWGLLFASPKDRSKHISITALPSALGKYQRTAGIERWAPRDIRRTVKTVLGQEGVAKGIRDRLHGHAMQDVSSRHYDRYDYLKEKRQAMDVWEKWLDSILRNGDDGGF
ncbi:hypothetical protein BTW10_14110 [Chromohalobacter japonicus]|uniref:Tyr recombinase domain-containing protein n=1 Tax=Chromohalobacter japonicus TaxID=223900 RepID=A0A1Q8T9Y1_9GAMM|nr:MULTISPECIES: site-specific integrase [Chromohalobacter]OLO10487.1 hypothetical protein BTW10_14110 [Chromohalobacter japonicus]